jgi:hypothetical protein
VLRKSVVSARAARLRVAAARLGWPEAAVAGLTVAFLAITIWGLAVDQATPDGDASRHLNLAFDFHDQWMAGHQLYWFRYEPSAGAVYPPLVFLVGALTTFLGGLSVDTPILALNVVFLPLLTLGCYGVGRVAFNRTAGLLAVVFALATPVVIGQFHLFLLDLPLTGMVAATAWAVLAGDRFADRRMAIVAGVLAGLGMLTKQSFVVFVSPLIILVLLRGGLRNWRNALIFGVSAGIIALPWYIEHFHALTRVATEATAQSAGADTNPYGPEYPRGSFRSFAWQGWALTNIHYFLPLTVLYLAGLVSAVVRWAGTRRPGYLPELIIGSLGGYVGVSLIFGFQDGRYSIPSLVFVAALAAGAIATVTRPLRIAGATLLVALLVVNTLAINTPALGLVQLRLPGANDTGEFIENRLVVLDERGYTGSRPQRAPRTFDLLEAAKQRGTPAFAADFSAQTNSRLNTAGMFLFARVSGLPIVAGDDPVMRTGRGIFLARRTIPPRGPRPCQRFEDGTGLYVFRGVPTEPQPTRRSRLTCPL